MTEGDGWKIGALLVGHSTMALIAEMSFHQLMLQSGMKYKYDFIAERGICYTNKTYWLTRWFMCRSKSPRRRWEKV